MTEADIKDLTALKTCTKNTMVPAGIYFVEEDGTVIGAGTMEKDGKQHLKPFQAMVPKFLMDMLGAEDEQQIPNSYTFNLSLEPSYTDAINAALAQLQSANYQPSKETIRILEGIIEKDTAMKALTNDIGELSLPNIELHQLPKYHGASCHLCGRSYPSTVLNIEAVIHHKAKSYVCINTKECRRSRRKRRH